MRFALCPSGVAKRVEKWLLKCQWFLAFQILFQVLAIIREHKRQNIPGRCKSKDNFCSGFYFHQSDLKEYISPYLMMDSDVQYMFWSDVSEFCYGYCPFDTLLKTEKWFSFYAHLQDIYFFKMWNEFWYWMFFSNMMLNSNFLRQQVFIEHHGRRCVNMRWTKDSVQTRRDT